LVFIFPWIFVTFLQVQNKVFQTPGYALGFARLWKSLGNAMPRSSIFIMAGFLARCPPASLVLEDTSADHSPAQAGTLR
jgi:hypothetical protein